MNFTEKFRSFIEDKFDMDLVGFASAEALAGEPAGHRPTDLLPGAKNVIVLIRKTFDGSVQGMFRVYENKKAMAAGAYVPYADTHAPNFLQANDSFELARYIEETYGAIAMPVPFHSSQSAVWSKYPAPSFTGPIEQGYPLNVYQAALAAGLGEYGWSNRFITPEYGPRIMVSAVVTTLDLDCDKPYSGKKLCDPEKCGVCVKLCPTHAISAVGKDAKVKSVDGKSCSVGTVKTNSCVVAACGLRKEFLARPMPNSPDLVPSCDPTDDELVAAFAKKAIPDNLVHFPTGGCDKCLLYCPAGNWKQHFADTGVSSFDPDKN